MADSSHSGAETADIVERRECPSPANAEALSARRSVSPNKRRGRQRSKDRKRRRRYDSSSSSSSESDIESEDSDAESSNDLASGGSSPSSSSSESDGAESEEQISKSKAPKAHESKERSRFDIDDDASKELKLPKDMSSYLLKKFNVFIPDKKLKELILDEFPLPSTSCIKAPELDDYVPDIFSANKSSYGKSYESNLEQIQDRIGLVMGPLSRIWLDLENIQTGRDSGENLDPSLWLDIVEKAITLLGQAFTTTTYHRRMNILYNLTKDVKDAKQLLKKNNKKLASSQKLFGKKFYKALSQSSRIRKKSREISKQLGSSSAKRKRRDNHFNNHREPKRPNQPFRSEAPSRGARGGGRINFKPRRPTKSPRGKSMSFIPRVTKSHSKKRVKSSGRGKDRSIPFKSDKSRSDSRRGKKPAARHDERKLPHRGKVTIFPEKLAVTNPRQLHSTSCSGHGDSISGTSNPGKLSLSETKPKECYSDRSRGSGNDPQESNPRGYSLPRSVSEPRFPCTKERRGSKTSYKLKKAKSVCEVRTLQDGGYPSPEISHKEGRLYGQTGLKRCIFWSLNPKVSSKIPSLLVERENIRIPSTPLWLRGGSSVLYKAAQTSNSLSPENRSTSDNLFGRHDIVKSVQTHADQRLGFPDMASGEPGFSDKLQEINVCSYTGNPVLGFSDRLCGDGYPSPCGKNSEDHSEVSVSNLAESNNSAENCKSVGLDDIFIASNSTGSPSLPALANDPNSHITDQSILPGKGNIVSPVHTRAEMVGFADAELEREVHYLCGSRYDNNKRCVQEGLGWNPWPQTRAGSLDRRGMQTTYQCTGTEGSTFLSEDFRPEYAEDPCSLENGQQNCSSLYPENGGHPLSTHVTSNSGNLAICPGQGDNSIRRIFTRVSEHGSGLAVQEFPGQQRLAIEEEHFSSIGQSLGPIPAGPVCEPPQYTAEKLCELAPGSIRTDGGCLSETVEREGSLFIPPIRHDRAVFDEGQTGGGDGGDCGTPLASPAMVPNLVVNVNRKTDSPPALQGPFNFPKSGNSSAVTAKTVPPSGMENLRRRSLDQGISKQAAELLTEHSWRKGTVTAYNSCWGQWSSWCHGRQIDPFCAPVVDIVNYLSERFSKGDTYRTLNSRRSAISAFHEPVDGVKIGQHALIRRLLTASFNARPPQPRYTSQWDVDIVLEYIISLGQSDSLSDKMLTQKLGMLLALASAGRTSELHAFDVRYMSDDGNSITFRLAKLTKSRKRGQSPLSVTFTIFSKEPSLCVVQTIRIYLSRSLSWRKRGDVERNQLLLSHVEPHKPVVSCTIAGWLVSLLKNAGIDTDQFKAHSTRGASTSKAKALGLSCNEILEAARWSKMTTFKRHYLREIVAAKKNKFQHTVLS